MEEYLGCWCCFIWRNQVIPVFDDQLLPVLGAIAVSSDVLMKEMGVGNNPGIESDFECVVGNHPILYLEIFIFLYWILTGERPGWVFLAGRSRRVLRGNGVF